MPGVKMTPWWKPMNCTKYDADDNTTHRENFLDDVKFCLLS